MQAVNWQSFGWKRNYVRVHPLGEASYNAWKIVGMPRIPDAEKLVCFLYKNKDDAKHGIKSGATGFVVGVPFKKVGSHVPKDACHYYIVTCDHVVDRFDNAMHVGSTVVRVSSKKGGSSIIKNLPVKNWVSDKNNDIAVCPIDLEGTDCDVSIIQLSMTVTKEQIEQADIGLGDDLFMVGRFVDHPSISVNEPVARFGSISRIVKKENSEEIESYYADMHSRTGFSGSPVIVYRTPGSNLKNIFEEKDDNKKYKASKLSFILLLGIHRGSFPEEWEVHRNIAKKGKPQEWEKDENLITKGASGLSRVIPAQYLYNLLMNDDDLKTMRKEKESEEEINRAGDGFPMQDEVIEGEGITGDQILKTMLNTPPETHEEIKDK